MKFSVIILLEELHSDFHQFVSRLYEQFSKGGSQFEIVLMANGTGSLLRSRLNELPVLNQRLRAFEFPTKTSQAVCLKAALKQVRGKILVVCGSYQQITVESLFKALDLMDDETDIIAPWRINRVDPSFNRMQSKLFNFIANKMTGICINDLSCTIKIFRREVLQETELYGNMYRFLPILAAKKGFKTKEVQCDHHEERGKTGLYSISEYANRLIDLLTLYFNTRFSKKPLRFFSSVGFAFIMTGLLVLSYLFIQRFAFSIPIGNRPPLFIALLTMILGFLVASVGLLGEIITFTNGRHKPEYTIEKII